MHAPKRVTRQKTTQPAASTRTLGGVRRRHRVHRLRLSDENQSGHTRKSTACEVLNVSPQKKY